MHMYVGALMMFTGVAAAAPAPVASASAGAVRPEPVVTADWAAKPAPDKALIRRAIRESFEEEEAIAAAASKAAAIPRRYTASSQPEQDKYEKFEMAFDDAKVPGCLQRDGLKRQSTFIFSGLLALPFIAVAAVRGKCN